MTAVAAMPTYESLPEKIINLDTLCGSTLYVKGNDCVLRAITQRLREKECPWPSDMQSYTKSSTNSGTQGSQQGYRAVGPREWHHRSGTEA